MDRVRACTPPSASHTTAAASTLPSAAVLLAPPPLSHVVAGLLPLAATFCHRGLSPLATPFSHTASGFLRLLPATTACFLASARLGDRRSPPATMASGYLPLHPFRNCRPQSPLPPLLPSPARHHPSVHNCLPLRLPLPPAPCCLSLRPCVAPPAPITSGQAASPPHYSPPPLPSSMPPPDGRVVYIYFQLF